MDDSEGKRKVGREPRALDISSEGNYPSSRASRISTISRWKEQSKGSHAHVVLPDVDVVALDDSVGEVGRQPRDDDRAGGAHRRLHAAGRAGNCKKRMGRMG